MSYISSQAYLAVKPEATAGTAVIPTIFIPLVSESIKTNPNYSADRRMKGINWKSDDLLRGIRKHEGDIVILADPDGLGHLFNMTLCKGTTTGSATGYTHPFTVGSPDSYTIEIQKGPYAQRLFGVKCDILKGAFVDQKLQVTASVKAMGQFSAAKLNTALSGSVTSLVLANGYDVKPNTGLVIGDVLSLKLDSGSYQDITLTSVNADGVTVGFGSLSITAAAGNPIYLKAQTPSFTGLSNPFMQGNTLVGVSTTSALADTAAATRAAATPMYEFAFSIKNNLFDGPATGSQDPVQLIPQVREAELTVSRTFENVEQHLAWLQASKQAVTMISIGDVITGGSTRESCTVKFHNVKLMNNDQALEVGSLIFDKQTLEVLYDAGDAMAIEVSIVNKTAGSAY